MYMYMHIRNFTLCHISQIPGTFPSGYHPFEAMDVSYVLSVSHRSPDYYHVIKTILYRNNVIVTFTLVTLFRERFRT